jgi:hypothetical protein
MTYDISIHFPAILTVAVMAIGYAIYTLVRK